MEIHDKCRQAGVVGAGGAGFPTYAKLNCIAEYVLANCAECEPMLRVDIQIIEHYAQEVVSGLRYAMKACGAKKGRLCIKGKHRKAIAALESACAAEDEIEVFLIHDYFPAGDEFQMVYDVTGRVVPVGGLPLDVGCVVQNASTLRNIARAQMDIPVTRKHVTVTGAVNRPVTIEVPIGMSYRECISLADGPTDETQYGLIIGGPMMGKVELNWDAPVTKTCGGIIVLEKSHPHYIHKASPVKRNLDMARKICCQCSLCTQMCPRNQLGLHVQPHKAMRAAAYGTKYEENGIHACSSCGVCSFFVCPFGLTPSSVMADAKGHLLEQGKTPVKSESTGVSESREYSHVPIKRLVARLGLSKYNVDAPLNEMRIEPDSVSIPTKMHIGVAAIPCINVGDYVVEGQVIARPPENALGVFIHASMNGVIASVTDKMIVIQR